MLELVVAIDDAGGIGYRGGLPWPRLSGDMAHFRRLTTGHTVVMGGRTYDGLPAKYRPLPDRRNVVLARTPRDGADTVSGGTVDLALSQVAELLSGCDRRVFVVGGAGVYEAALRRGVCAAYVTRVAGVYPADARLSVDFSDYLSLEGIIETGRGYCVELWKRRL